MFFIELTLPDLRRLPYQTMLLQGSMVNPTVPQSPDLRQEERLEPFSVLGCLTLIPCKVTTEWARRQAAAMPSKLII
jgi:hypothetical protein